PYGRRGRRTGRPSSASWPTRACRWTTWKPGSWTASWSRSIPPPSHRASPGVIGLESFDRTGLLRSLAVDPASRGAGIGAELVAALEGQASDAGITDLWLL